MAPEQAAREGVAESLSSDDKTGNPQLEEMLSQNSSPGWLFLPPGISLVLGQWMETLAFCVCPAGIAVNPACPSPPWLCPCPLPILGTSLEGSCEKVPALPARWKMVLLTLEGYGLVAWAEGWWPSPSCLQKRHHCSSFGRAPAPLLSLQSSSSSCLVPSPSQEGEVGQNLHSLPGFSA